MNTALFVLRSKQMGLSIEELNILDIGTVLDMMTESGNDNCEYGELPTQEDFNNF